MSLPLRLNHLRWKLLAPIVLSLISLETTGPRPSAACGPFFPNQIIVNGDSGILTMPIGDFVAEINALRPQDVPASQRIKTNALDYRTVFQKSADADLDELRSTLKAAGVALARSGQICLAYETARKVIAQHAEAVSSAAARKDPTEKVPPMDAVTLPDGLPPEFADYLRGLIAFHREDVAAARAAWNALLARPANQRRLRSTWAAFMLGKSFLNDDPAQARQWFARTRSLAAEGFADSLDLATSSLGWEARTELSAGHIAAAISIYLQQHWRGDSTAAMSLRTCARAAFEGGAARLTATAGDELSRRVIAAYVLSGGGPHMRMSAKEKLLIPQWLAAVEAVAARNVAGADRFAWAAYVGGEFDSAARWVAAARADSPVAQWVKAKLLLRDGKVADATSVLAGLVKSFPPDDKWLDEFGIGGEVATRGVPRGNIIPPIAGDLAVLQLARGQYTASLDLLLRSDFWMDAAYVAERVLSADELKAYVDRRFPEQPPVNTAMSASKYIVNLHANQLFHPREIRHLLARRLTRLGRWREARPYYPPELREVLDDYISAIRIGNDASRPPAERAAAFLSAAQIARLQGMELLGTELDPDFYCYEGSFVDHRDPSGRSQKKPSPLTAPTNDELSRVNASALADARRFHYRWIAAEHAWSGIQLMPDNTEETAATICEAGSWLKDADPQFADRFYKALVLRCGLTPLGKQAAALRWFPKTTLK